jgi:superoxide reductase
LCGNIIEVLIPGSGIPSCCDQPMKRFVENTVDAAKEKHVPAVEKIDGGYKVKVGTVAHPMEEKHYIQWIELKADGRVMRQFLKPGTPAEAVFITPATAVTVREYCNLHGLWKGA